MKTSFLKNYSCKILIKRMFSIFHKASQIVVRICMPSSYVYHEKLALYKSVIHRINNMPLSKANFNKIFGRIKRISINSGYRAQLIDTLDILN